MRPARELTDAIYRQPLLLLWIVDAEGQNKTHRGGKKAPINLGWLQLEAESWTGLQAVKDALTSVAA